MLLCFSTLFEKIRLVKFRGIDKKSFDLHLKECEFRFSHRGEDLYKLLLEIFRKEPLKLSRPNFFYMWNRFYNDGVLFGWEGKTSGIKNLLFDNFVNCYKEVFPDNFIIEKFYNIVYPLHVNIQKNLLQNQKLTQLRDWLLPMLMNRQVTVSDANQMIKELMAAESSTNYEKGKN